MEQIVNVRCNWDCFKFCANLKTDIRAVNRCEWQDRFFRVLPISAWYSFCTVQRPFINIWIQSLDSDRLCVQRSRVRMDLIGDRLSGVVCLLGDGSCQRDTRRGKTAAADWWNAHPRFLGKNLTTKSKDPHGAAPRCVWHASGRKPLRVLLFFDYMERKYRIAIFPESRQKHLAKGRS